MRAAAVVAFFTLCPVQESHAASLRLVGAAGHTNVTTEAYPQAAMNKNVSTMPPALPFNLAIVVDQCKCTFVGLCNCSAAVEFMTCVNDACASGECDCKAWHFVSSCNDMAAACPQDGLSCSTEKATCMHAPISGSASDASEEELIQQLATLRQRKCKLQRASQQGYVNAAARLQELELEIQGRLDVLKARGAQPVYMGCDAGPPEGWGVSWMGGNAVPTTTVAAPPQPRQIAPVQAPVPTMSPLAQREHNRFWIMFTKVSVYILFVLLAAYIYNKYRYHIGFPQGKGSEDADGFLFGLFGCFQDSKLSLLAFCCPIVRWADTMDKADEMERDEERSRVTHKETAPRITFINYWRGVFLAATLMALQLYVGAAAVFPLAAGIFGTALLLVAVLYRQRLRRRYDMDAGSCRTFTEDCLTWLCCPCCAVVQEARQVEQDWPDH